MGFARSGNIKGPKGDDAYTIAVEAGFSGTRADWLASLKGAAGARGSVWTTGNGAPSATASTQPGDLYLDLASGDVYQAS